MSHSAEFLRGWLDGLREQVREATTVLPGDLPHVTQMSLIERADEIKALLAQAEARETAPDAAAVIAQCRAALGKALRYVPSETAYKLTGKHEVNETRLTCKQALAAIAAYEDGR